MTRTVRWFLALDVVVFGLAALLHAGVLTTGYEHREARIAETVIGVVLFLGLLVTVATPCRFSKPRDPFLTTFSKPFPPLE
jgi:hypothetical protein